MRKYWRRIKIVINTGIFGSVHVQLSVLNPFQRRNFLSITAVVSINSSILDVDDRGWSSNARNTRRILRCSHPIPQHPLPNTWLHSFYAHAVCVCILRCALLPFARNTSVPLPANYWDARHYRHTHTRARHSHAVSFTLIHNRSRFSGAM